MFSLLTETGMIMCRQTDAKGTNKSHAIVIRRMKKVY